MLFFFMHLWNMVKRLKNKKKKKEKHVPKLNFLHAAENIGAYKHILNVDLEWIKVNDFKVSKYFLVEQSPFLNQFTTGDIVLY